MVTVVEVAGFSRWLGPGIPRFEVKREALGVMKECRETEQQVPLLGHLPGRNMPRISLGRYYRKGGSLQIRLGLKN